MHFIQLLVGGLQTGAIYALTAVGFSLIFGMTRIFHVAHGATFVLAGYVFLSLADSGWTIAILGALAVAVAFGVIVERLVYMPIKRSDGSFFTVFVASFGLTIIVQSFVELVFGRGFVAVSSGLTRSTEVMPRLYIAPVFFISIAVAAVLFLLLTLFLRRTNMGVGLRALAQNPDLLSTYGLSSARLSILAFAIGSALVVPGAVLTAATSGLQPFIGHHLMLISLASMIVGGIGSLWGTALAGVMLGVAESLSVYVLETQWSEAASFFILFAFILFRPNGMFGSKIKVH